MPLYDHFHGDLGWRPWESFHSQWSGCIAAALNRRLPKRFIADATMHLGSAVAADVVEYETRNGHERSNGADGNSGVAVATETEVYAPPATDLQMPIDFPPELKVEVKDVTRQYRVVAVVELVSPANKDRDEYREQFAAKCLSYLAKGIGLVVLDIVTESRTNLHNVLIHLAEFDSRFAMTGDPSTYAVAYRPVSRKDKNFVDLWQWPLAVGSPLPAVPLALKGFGCVRLDLETTYAEACERSRIPS